MKSNQRWLKLRTTVQLSGALSSSMNRTKPPLKREDSFIKRFSTRQIAEIQDTVDQTDEEDISKNSTGSPKIRKKRKKRQPRTVINPYGNVYFYWLCVLTICVLYNLWTPIVRQAFPELQRRPQPLWYLSDGMTDMIFLLDILIQFRTGYLEQGLIVYDFKKLANHYMHSRSFMLDLVSLFPLDILQLLIGTHPIIRFPRFIKVYRVYNYYYMVESRTLYPNMWRVVNLVHILLLLAHWFGCFYYMLSEAEHFRGDWTYPYHDLDSDFKTLSRKYLGSVYWSTLTLTTIGDLPTPETNRQGNTSLQPLPRSLALLDPSFTRPGHITEQVTEMSRAMSPARPDPGGITKLVPVTQGAPGFYLHPGGSPGPPRISTEYSDGDGGVSPALSHLIRASPSFSGPSSPDPAPSGSSQAEPNSPRALPRRGLKSRILRIKTNVGYIFTIVSYLIGVFIFATIVGQVGNVITNRNANRLEFERLLDGAKLYMRHHKVPRAMQRRVQRWYDYSWSRGRIQGGGDINTALGLLPDKLRTELALHVNLLTLKKVSIFKECQPEFLHDLVLKMKAYIFTPGDLICRKGEVAREMFIIADGILEVISETGKVLTTMKAGDFFGEIGILNLDGLNKRTADVRSVGYSELFSLSREDVLMAMKDYPEAQEILQSLGRKRLMDARHTSKSGSSGSSKRGTPSPNKDGGVEDKIDPLKIVSRIKSDVSAIRNAFRRSKGTTKYMETLEQDNFTGRKTDNETLELEHLTGEIHSSTEDDAPAVKRILKKISGSGRSGSDSSGGGARGVLKRMSRVTSDEMNQTISPGRLSSNEEPQGLLGAGLPLLQRLKLLKEKEEIEDKERQRLKEEEEENAKLKKQEPPEQEEEPGIIGAGLPLFARLRLLKVKEEKERMEREEREKAERNKAGEQQKESTTNKPDAAPKKITSPVTDGPGKLSPFQQETQATKDKPHTADAKPRPAGMLKGKLRAALLTSAAPPTTGTGKETPSVAATQPTAGPRITPSMTVVRSPTTPTGSIGTTAEREKKEAELDAKHQLKSPINDLNKGVDTKTTDDAGGEKLVNNGSSVISKDIHSNSNSVQGGQALERAFGKLLSKKLNTPSKERTSVAASDKSVVDSSKLTESKDKISRSDSFKRAMDEGRIRSTEEHDLNIKPHESVAPKLQSTRESDSEEVEQVQEDKKVGESQSENEVSPINEEKPVLVKKQIESIKKSSDTISKCDTVPKPSRTGSKEKQESPKVLRSQSTGSGVAIRQYQKVDCLKVPSDDVSPPLSSPESTETPERKTLKSILKRMSREDSRGNLLPPDGADLRKLMKAPTVEGFVARRSKLSKTVSFQRKTLSSPPPPALLDELKNSQQLDTSGHSVPEILPSSVVSPAGKDVLKVGITQSTTHTDGVNKLMVKLGTIGLDGAQETQAQDLVLGVRKILRDKMDDVEVAWVARVEELQQQLADRDATIRQLTHTISVLQAGVGSEVIVTESSQVNGSATTRCPTIIRSSSSDASSDGSDDDEPLFMRCNSIESIIHQSPEGSPEGRHVPLGTRRSWPHQTSVDQCPPQQTRLARSLEDSRVHGDVTLDIGSSTDDDICSFSSDDDHILYGNMGIGVTETEPNDALDDELSDGLFPDEDEIDEDDVECGESGEAELNSQDWEVQLLARQLAEDQRGFARKVDRDIAEGRLDSALADLHEALATDNLGPLTDEDLLRLEKAVRREREKLRRYARVYSLDERPLLEDQFTSLYRSRSQLLLNRSSELCLAGPTERRLSLLLEQLTKMSPAEQFLLDRLVYTTDRKRRLSRQRSLCDEHLASYNTDRIPISNRSNRSLANRRSMSVCSPPPGTAPPAPLKEATLASPGPLRERGPGGESGPPTVSAMLASLQRSVAAIRGRGSGNNQSSHKEGAPLLKPYR
ncbi:uncharacterized protein LOC121875372 isoform X2 [Homarus americanus]|uniref:uncharacterized protein LOC121875372 isoform X2 n=1 Tax=Homarus americanus TaxID=6706 RepID=UPI001C495715|nr:uncharacterized protein LOC121875372 isoform X2 [Homarus americanus]